MQVSAVIEAPSPAIAGLKRDSKCKEGAIMQRGR